MQLPRLLEVYDQLFKTRVIASDIMFQCITFANIDAHEYKLHFLWIEHLIVSYLNPPMCLLPVGSLLAAAEETSPLGGVYPRASVRIRG